MRALKRLSWLEKLFLLAAVLFLLSDLSLALLWNRAQAQENAVEVAIVEKARRVEVLRVDMDVVELNRRLGEVQAALEKVPFPQEDPGPRLEELILTAEQLTVHGVSLGDEGKEKVGGREYRALISHIECRGPLSSLVSHMRGLVAGAFPTLFLDNISLSQGETGWEATFDIVLLLQGEGT
ncbi:MAG TPA: hypothetical protein VJ565_03785 [Dehalococcoidia bacterium]|nr:hypothetical protein [Dehalococcoidia bacterium]